MVKTLLLLWGLMFAASAIADDSEFTLSKICRAGVATNYGREISSIQALQIDINIIRINYERPEDNHKFIFLCRQQGTSRLNLLDESLTGARWYGSDLADKQTLFSKKDNVLIIRLVNNGILESEVFFREKDFTTKR